MLYPSEWQIRCVTCGRTRPALEAGIVRIAPALRKYTLAPVLRLPVAPLRRRRAGAEGAPRTCAKPPGANRAACASRGMPGTRQSYR